MKTEERFLQGTLAVCEGFAGYSVPGKVRRLQAAAAGAGDGLILLMLRVLQAAVTVRVHYRMRKLSSRAAA